MGKEMLQSIKIAIALWSSLLILTGLVYPGFVTAIAQWAFPWKANGSLLEKNGRIVGSQFIGQSFTAPYYFWGRPSATTPFPYNAALSAGSNLGPTNPLLLRQVQERITHLREFKTQYPFVPVDLVTASGSGLDPEISPIAAFYQMPRIAQTRQIPEMKIQALINQFIVHRTCGFLGEPRINVLQLNLALDYFFPIKGVE